MLQSIHKEIKVSHLGPAKLECIETVIRYSERFNILMFFVIRESHRRMVNYISPTNTLEFPRANILDERPFIVMPYMRNRNFRDHLQWHLNRDRLQIVCIFNIHAFTLARCDNLQLHGISLSLVHFNSLQIVHGDLKAVRSREKSGYIVVSNTKWTSFPA